MDLDFSFALVSSLTPRRKAEKSSLAENLKNTKSLKTKLNLPSKTQNPEEISRQKREEKENIIPKEQLMNQDEFPKSHDNKRYSNPSNNSHRRQSNDTMLSSFSINMENIAVRRNRTRGRKKIETNPFQPPVNVSEISDGVDMSNLPNERLSLCAPEVINISSDIDENCRKTQSNKSKTVRGKSPRLKRVSDSSVRSSLEEVESSCSEVKDDSFGNEKGFGRSLRSWSTKKPNVKTRSTRVSGLSETSLSTAYDSDSFQALRRPGAKVIPETPDTDKSSRESFNEKRKSSVLSFTSGDNKETHNLCKPSCTNVRSKKNASAKRKSSEISGSPDEKRYGIESSPSDLRPKRKSSLLSSTSEKNKEVDEFGICGADNDSGDKKLETINTAYSDQVFCDPPKPFNRNKAEVRRKKKLRTSDDSTALDMFKLESTIKDQSPPSEMKKEGRNKKFGIIASGSNKKQQENNISPVSKGKNKKLTYSKNSDLGKKKRIKEKELNNLENISKLTIGDSVVNLQRTKNKHCSPISPKMSTLVLPSEVIPKFEHINQWLKDTQELTIGSVERDSATSKKDMNKNKHKVSLSPRIKKKKDKAKNSLEEEKKLFEELYGTEYDKRLSDDVDEVTSRTSCQDSVEFSENVLDKLYGTVWKKNSAITQSEPRKGKNKSSKNSPSLTERKKHRTSIYEVFSSSSSEDRFEEFLENVHRGKVKSTKRHSGRPASSEFINDSESEDNASLVFYQNIVSSAVKDEVNNLKGEQIMTGQDICKVNRRRLSFGSSKDGCSETNKSDTKSISKSKKCPKENPKTKKSRSKKKANKYIEGKCSDDIDVFPLVTPLKIKGKKTDSDISEKVINTVVLDVPRSVGKSKTPKNPIRLKDPSNSEERLKTTYLRDCDFKVPKSASKMFKTPSKTYKPDVQSSPALSFLSSLSEMTAGLPCHPDALVYKKNFKSKREELTKRLFTLYNKEVFDNQLPADMLIQWSTRMTSTSGYCYNKRIYRDNQVLRSSRIVLSTKILDRADRLRDTLVHELCHAATWIIHATSDGHGPIWRSWADKANRRFPELPVIKRCHDYAISTKFTYKCMTCGYSIGRHTKSLDTERKRCGFCFGKFQVFVTAKMSSASVTSGSDSVKAPRNPTGFALFVKEHYAIIKKENNVPHAQVMKLLSQKFAEVKISKQNADEPIVIE